MGNTELKNWIRMVLSFVLTILAWGWVAFALFYCFVDGGRFWRFGVAALVGSPSLIRHDVLIDVGPLDQGGMGCFVVVVWLNLVLLFLSMVSLGWILRRRSHVTRRFVGWGLAVWQIPVLGCIFLFYWETARFVAVYGVGYWYSLVFRSMFVSGLVFLAGWISLLIPKVTRWRWWKRGLMLLLLSAAIQTVAVVGIFAAARHALATHPKPTEILPVDRTVDGGAPERTPLPMGRFWGLERLVLGPAE